MLMMVATVRLYAQNEPGSGEKKAAIDPLKQLKELEEGIVIAGLLAGLSTTHLVGPSYGGYLFQLSILIAGARLSWAMLDWVSRLYVLTNRRVMSIRGAFSVELYECGLDRIQDTRLTLSPAERLARVGTVTFQTASGDSGFGTWRIVARPLEVHEKLRDTIISIRATRHSRKNELFRRVLSGCE